MTPDTTTAMLQAQVQQLQAEKQELSDMLQFSVIQRNQVSNDILQTSAKLMAEQRKVKELTDKLAAFEQKVVQELEAPKANGADAAAAKKDKRAETRPN